MIHHEGCYNGWVSWNCMGNDNVYKVCNDSAGAAYALDRNCIFYLFLRTINESEPHLL